jgi:hypothetical protein
MLTENKILHTRARAHTHTHTQTTIKYFNTSQVEVLEEVSPLKL